MLSLLLLAHAVARRPQTLTFVERGARVPVVLQEIAAKTGLELKANRAFENRVLCISVHDASTEKTLSQIAKVLDGEWSVTANSWILGPSLSKARQTQIELENERLAVINKDLKHYRSYNDTDHDYDIVRLKAQAKKNEDAAFGGTVPDNDYSPGGPNARLLIRLVSLVPQETLGHLQNGDRIVFSNLPNRMQIGFASGFDETIAQYRRDWAITQSLMADDDRADILRSGSPILMQKILPELPKMVKIDLSLAMYDGIKVQLRVFNSKGVEIESDSQEIDAIDYESRANADVAALDKQERIKGNDVLSDPELQALRRFYTTTPVATYHLPENATVDPAWLAKVLDPIQYEQVGVVQGSRWLQIAGQLGMDLVGTPSDEFHQTIIEQMRRKNAYPASWFARIFYRSELDGHCLLIKPEESDEGEASINRFALRNLIRDTVNESSVTIPSLLQYLSDSPAPKTLRLWDRWFLNYLLRQSGGGGFAITSPQVDGLRLYGTLSAEQRQLLHQGPLLFKNLSAATLESLHRSAFGIDMFGQLDEGEFEPTEVLPDGLRDDGRLQITDEHDDLVVVPVADMQGQTVSVAAAQTAREMGIALAAKANDAARAVKRFRLGHRHAFTLQTEFTPNFIRKTTLSETTYAPKQFMTFDELPLAFKQSVEVIRAQRTKALKELEKEEQQGATAPDKNPPP